MIQSHSAMNPFLKMMQEVNEIQFNNFTKMLKNKMSRKEYISVFLSTFLGSQFNFDQHNDMFDTICHESINMVSLCEDEIQFFHMMVDHMLKQNYVEEMIEKYHSIPNLARCQLGPNILRCLEYSKKIEVV